MPYEPHNDTAYPPTCGECNQHEFDCTCHDCEHCGAEVDYQECWKCGGEGGRGWEDLQFENPLWYDEKSWIKCDVCDGEGHFRVCPDPDCKPEAEASTK